ncbi:MAG: hypothetical protein K9G76_03430 [Bacteroidales bacterium]|nr:hypothetical protein [Bacteroidales bacterium]MCF8402845.1 hypothetical protein [Bacteroidales bacterium]
MNLTIQSLKGIALILMLNVQLLFIIEPVQAQYTLHDVYGDLEECDTMTRSIYVVWWDHDFNYGAQVDVLLDSMISYRNTCLDELLMSDPPNALDGYYYNVYIHTPGNPNGYFYPYGWGNGQGTDPNGYPFLTLPNGVLNDWVNNSHETFHIFQYNANSPGFSYSGNSQWYIEASANWFAAKENITAPRAFVEAESLVRIPHVPLWLSYNNFPSYYPQNWQRYVHQYAMALQLYYLTDVAGIPDQMITQGFFNGTSELPQEYLFNQLGGALYRNYFIDWAAHMTNNFDFIAPNQAATNLNEWLTYADPLDDNEFTQVYTNTGSNGWYQPADSLITTAWSYNTYKISNSISGSYTFELNGNPTGSYGDEAWFQGKVLVQNSETGTGFYDLDMSNNCQGSLALNATLVDTALYFIITSMPETFGDNNPVFQLFPYEMRITAGPMVTGISDIEPHKAKKESARFNTMGQRVSLDEEGLQIIFYDDGSADKVFVK